MCKQIAVDLAKSVCQVAESVRAGQVSQRKRLNRETFRRYIQEQAEPVEWLMETCGTAHYWGRLAQSQGHRATLLHPCYVRPYLCAKCFVTGRAHWSVENPLHG